MISEVTVATFHQNFDRIFSHVESHGDSVIISKDGKPVAALINANLFARARRMQERFEAATSKIAADFSITPMEQGLAEIDTVVALERNRHNS